jgi:hypothetical protein
MLAGAIKRASRGWRRRSQALSHNEDGFRHNEDALWHNETASRHHASSSLRYATPSLRYITPSFRYTASCFRYAAAFFRYARPLSRYDTSCFRYAARPFCYAAMTLMMSLVSNPFNQGNPQDDQPQPQKSPAPQQGHFSARVPEKVNRGVYCTGQVIHDSPKEFVIDFLQGLNRPFQVVARIVMTPQTMHEFVNTFEENLGNYRKQFGEPHAPQTPPPERRPTIEEIYENFKLPEEIYGGTYANNVIIGHAPTEFLFDFLTAFYPTPAVGARVILPAGQAPKFLNTLRSSLQQYQQRYMKPAQQQQPPQQPPPSSSSPGTPGEVG